MVVMEHRHQPVLLNEATELLNPQRGGVFIDGTLGLGGHAEELLRINPQLRLIGIDQDPDARAAASARLEENVTIIAGNFRNISELASEQNITTADGILLDIGVSSLQLDDPSRGFSFREQGALDMRMDPNGAETAADLVNTLKERDLADLSYQFSSNLS